MTIKFVNKGATQTAASGSITPVLPAGWLPNDIFLCIVASSDNKAHSMTGWTAIDTGTNNGTGLRTSSFFRRAQRGDTNPTVSHSSGSTIEATILAYRGVITKVSPLDVTGTVSANVNSTTVTANSITTKNAGVMVIFTGSTAGASSAFSTYSGTPTPIERLDTGSTTPSSFVAEFLLPVSATGNRTATATVTGVNNGHLFALRPVPMSISMVSMKGGERKMSFGTVSTRLSKRMG